MNTTYNGSGALFLKHAYGYLLLMAPLLSLCIMGMSWFPAFAVLMVLSLVVIPPSAFLVSRFDGFSFNDAERIIIKPFGGRLSYDALLTLHVRETGRMVSVSAGTGWLKSITLVACLPRAKKDGLLAEITRRAPGIKVRETRNADWKTVLLISAGMAVLTAGFHLFVIIRHPAVSAVPHAPEWGERSGAPEGREYVSDRYRFVLPLRYYRIGQEGEAQFFEETGNPRAEMRVVVRQQEPHSGRALLTVFLRFLGLGDHPSILRAAYRARFGIVPLVLKDFALWDMQDLRILALRHGMLSGFAVQGKRRGREETTISLASDSDRSEITFYITDLKRMEDTDLQRIISSVHQQQEQP